jgi:two-component system response regulator DevR
MAGYGARDVRVYLLDDHDLVRRGMRDLVAAAPDIEVVGDSASAGTAALDIVRRQVDVALLDLQLQDGSGVAVARRLRAAEPSIKVLLLTAASPDDALVATVLAGADGYLLKVAPPSDIVGAIRRLATGRTVLDPAAVARGRALVEERRRTVRPPPSDREVVLVDLLVAGASDAAIAARLAATEESVAGAIERLVDRIVFGGRSSSAMTETPPPAVGKHRRED